MGVTTTHPNRHTTDDHDERMTPLASAVSRAMHSALLDLLVTDPEPTRRDAIAAIDRALPTAQDAAANDLRTWRAALVSDDLDSIRAWCTGDDPEAVRMRAPGVVLHVVPLLTSRRIALERGTGVRDGWTFGTMDYSFISDQVEGESPGRWYTFWRYCNRMLEPKRAEQRGAEIVAISLPEMSHRARYLLRHGLILGGTYKNALNTYPNLRGLHTRALDAIDEPIVLSDHPHESWTYLHRKNIVL